MSLVQHAAMMALRGYKVFPLREGGKIPAHKGWLHEATDDLSQIEYLWAENPNYNIGVLTNGFVVADLDTAKASGVVEAFYARGGRFDDTFVVRTASGGYHCYYASGSAAGYEQSYHQAINRLAAGLDIKSYHNYVVGPGSRTSKGEYAVLSDRPVSRIPSGIESDLRPAGQPLTRDDSAQLDQPHNVALARQYLAAAPPAVEGQGGDNATFALAARITRDYAISNDTAYTLLEEWNQRCMPPWEPDELYNKIVNASAYGQNDLGKRTPDASYAGAGIQNIPQANTLPPPIPPTPPPQEEGDGIIDAFDFESLQFGNHIPAHLLERRRWKVENLALEDQVTILAGQGAAGKSTLELVFAAHFSLGRQLGPYKPPGPLKMAIYNAEDDRHEQSRRMYAICLKYLLNYEEVMKNIIFVDSTHSDLMFLSESNHRIVISRKNVDGFMAFVNKHGLDMVIIDPLANIHGVSENDTTAMQRLMITLRQIAQRTHCALVVAHHTKKAGRDRDSQDTVRGSSTAPNATRNTLLLSPADKEDVKGLDIPAADVGGWVRLVNVKINVGKKRVTYWKFEEVRIPVDRGTYAEEIGVLVYKEPRKRDDIDEDEALEQVAKTVASTPVARTNGAMFYDVASAIMLEQATGAMPLPRVIEYLRERVPEADRKSVMTYQRLFKDRIPPEGVRTNIGLLKCEKEGRGYVITLT